MLPTTFYILIDCLQYPRCVKIMGKEHAYKVLKAEIDKAKAASSKRKNHGEDEPAAEGTEVEEPPVPPKKPRTKAKVKKDQ